MSGKPRTIQYFVDIYYVKTWGIMIERVSI